MADHLVDGAEAQARHDLAQLLGYKEHKVLDVLGLAAEAAAGVPAGAAHRTALACGAGRGIHSLFDGEVDAAVLVNADDLDLDLLPFLEMILHIVDIGIGDL